METFQRQQLKMFTMALLRGILLFSVITVSFQALPATAEVSNTPIQPCLQTVITSDEILDLKVQMAKLNTKIEQQNTKFEQQNTKFEQQNTKFEQHSTKFANQNTKLAEQDNNILELNTNNKDLEMKVEKLASKTGSLFTRWGRRDCPSDVSQLVYSGITGGSHYTETGAAAEYVCLPTDPSLIKTKSTKHEGYMYGAEYEWNPRPIQNYDVPCAVCQTSQFSKVLMIPAKSECYPGWQKAYHGELGSGKHDHAAASQYICLDNDPQTIGTNDNKDGKLVYPVRAKCGSLPCPPYEDNALLTCVVCLN